MAAEFVPQVRKIASITRASPAVVTTTENHEYNAGLYVRIFIPYPESMPQINNRVFLANILSNTTFSVEVDSRNFDPFQTSLEQSAQVVPLAEDGTTLDNAVQNVRI